MGNPWVTFGNRKLDLIDPDPQAITLRALANSLAMMPRWSGHMRAHYSVAEHETRAAWLASPAARGYAFCHDHAEAVWHDLPAPAKDALRLLDSGSDGVSAYDRAYAITDRAMHRAFGLQWPAPLDIKAEVRRVDLLLLATEKRDLTAPDQPEWDWTLPAPMTAPIIPIEDWREAAEQFCQMARLLHFLGDLPRLPERNPRCFICGWPYAADESQGCVPGNCSYRPAGSRDDERNVGYDIRRAQLRAFTAGSGCDR